jgi:hypothetical protein
LGLLSCLGFYMISISHVPKHFNDCIELTPTQQTLAPVAAKGRSPSLQDGLSCRHLIR